MMVVTVVVAALAVVVLGRSPPLVVLVVRVAGVRPLHGLGGGTHLVWNREEKSKLV